MKLSKEEKALLSKIDEIVDILNSMDRSNRCITLASVISYIVSRMKLSTFEVLGILITVTFRLYRDIEEASLKKLKEE